MCAKKKKINISSVLRLEIEERASAKVKAFKPSPQKTTMPKKYVLMSNNAILMT